MKVITKFFTFVLLLSLMLSVSAVVAEENITFEQNDILKETVTPDNIQELENQNSQSMADNAVDDNTVLSEDSPSNFSQIQDKIDNASDGDTIFLDGKTYLGDGEEIIVYKSITIIGGANESDTSFATLDARGLSRIMKIGSDNVVIKGITFINGRDGEAGAVLWDGDDGSLSDSVFINNTALIAGALEWDGDNGNMVNTIFYNNSAEMIAGAVYWAGDNSILDTNRFFENHANIYVGALSLLSENSILKNSHFNSNRADRAGAVMVVSTNLTCAENEFISNSATYAGAILSMGNITIENNKFEKNSAKLGSLIWAFIGNQTFSNNDVKSSEGPVAYVTEPAVLKYDNLDESQVISSKIIIEASNLLGQINTNHIIEVHVHDTLGNEFSGYVYIYYNETNYEGNLVDGFETFEILLPEVPSIVDVEVGFILDYKFDLVVLNVTQVDDNTINVTLPEDSTGNVSLTIGDKIFSSDVVNDNAVINLGTLPNGKYEGELKYGNDTLNLTVVVRNSPINAEVIVPDTVALINRTIPLSVIILDDLKKPLNGAIVICNCMDIGYSSSAVMTDGQAVFTIPAINSPQTLKFVVQMAYSEKEIKLMTVDVSQANNTLVVKLPADALGNVSLSVGPNSFTSNVSNGSAIIDFDSLKSGNYTGLLSFSGYSNAIEVPISVSHPPVADPVYRISQNKDINVLYSGKATYKVLLTKDGKAASGEYVAITFNGKSVRVKTDAQGYATLGIGTSLKLGTYSISAAFNGLSVKNKVKINQIIKASDKKVKKSAKVTKIKISLAKVDGKALSKKTLKIKFNKKTYKVKTNKKGVGTWKVKKSMLKKIKVGKKVKYTVTYGKAVVTKKLTIKK